MSETILNIIWMGGPVLLSPLFVKGLRPLHGLFLREGVEMFTEVNLERGLSNRIGHILSITNVIIFLMAWIGAYGSRLLEWPRTVSALLAIGGVFCALAITVWNVRDRVGIVGKPAMLVGLVVFAGGNLPVIVLIPILFLFL